MTSTTTELTGEVVRAGDPGYEEARLGYNRLYQRSPQAIVFCRNTADVVNAVRYAREAGIAFRARSGRHNLEGWSAVDGGLIIDVSRMKDIDVDESAGTATVGTGLVQKEAVAALGERGYAIPTGSEGGVGLGGVVLGGGLDSRVGKGQREAKTGRRGPSAVRYATSRPAGRRSPIVTPCSIANPAPNGTGLT